MRKKSRKSKALTSKKILRAIEKVIDHKIFRPISIVIIASFVLFNGVLFIRNSIADYKERAIVAEKQTPIKIRITKKGKVLDFDELQIAERRIKSGDNILSFLFDIGIDEADNFAILSALKKVYDPRSIVVGDAMIAKYKVKINYIKSKKGLENIDRIIHLDEFRIRVSPEVEYVVTKLDNGEYKAKKIKQILTKKIVKYKGVVKDGLFIDATEVGASPNAVMNMIALYGYSVDFQRDIRKGNKFEIVVESFYTKGGRKVRDGNILFAMLGLKGRKIEMYAHRLKNETLQYFDKKGNSVRRSLLRTPVNGARISSRFGFRRHPVLGYSKLHKGVDFAAPRGTPIFAAGKGVITYRGRYGGYGNFIKIRHNSTYETAYAHISRFNKRFRKGSRVKQGDVIAYVGTTGRSTGPHLHFEVRKRGKAINPAKVKAVSSNRLRGSELKRFKKSRDKIEKYRKDLAANPV